MARAKNAAAKVDAGSETDAGTDEAGETSKHSALLLMQHDALGDVLGDLDLGTDGLEEVDASDIRLAALVWNSKALDQNEEPIAATRFYNTITEEVTQEETLALLTLHKSHVWKEYDSAESRNKIRCSSWDRVTGRMEDGRERPCDDPEHPCPDKQWGRDPETGKRGRHCSDVANVVALRLKDGQPVILRFTRTSERPWIDYLNKHVLGKRTAVVNGKRVRTHMPLFAHPTTVRLEMVKGAASPYARPVLERGEAPFSKDEILYFAESAKAYRETHLDEVRKIAEGAPGDDDGGGAANSAAGRDAATSFDAADFGDDFDAPVADGGAVDVSDGGAVDASGGKRF